MFRFRALAALALASAVCLAAPARADHLALGTFLGTGTGDNDTEALIESIFGFAPGSIMMLARIPGPDGLPVEGTEVDGLSYDNFFDSTDNPGEPGGGDWFYAGPEVVDLIAVKAGPNWGVFQFDDGLNQGGFSSEPLDENNWRGFGDVTAYKIVPEPATLSLVGLGLLALAGARRRSV
jgi:hypothetical protein